MKTAKQLQQNQIRTDLPRNKELTEHAKNIRKQVARKIIDDDSFISSGSESSYLYRHEKFLKHSSPNKLVRFNLEVSAQAIDYILYENFAPFYKLFLCSRVIEHAHYQYVDYETGDFGKPYLGVSKEFGIFFTPPKISTNMANWLLSQLNGDAVILDPASGMGSLLGSVLYGLVNLDAHKDKTIKSLYGIELDSHIATLSEKVLKRVISELGLNIDLKIITEDSITLLSDDRLLSQNGLPSTFDGIIMNPPYGRVRFEKSRLTNGETEIDLERNHYESVLSSKREEAGQLTLKIEKIAQSCGISQGLKEYPKLFIALSLARLSKRGAMSAIVPDSWMGSKTYLDLRRQLFDRHSLQEVHLYKENEGLFATVNQSTSVINVSNHSPVDRITLYNFRDAVHHIEYKTLKELSPENLYIPKISGEELDILTHLQQFQTIKENNRIHNYRGELDQTNDKESFTEDVTDMPLVRGENVERYKYQHSINGSSSLYVKDKFIQKYRISKPKFKHTRQARIVGRQVSYANKKRRLSFAIVPENHALGNSCNYLFVEKDDHDDNKLWALLGILNSAVIEWFFRIYNSNNHVSNYEINGFPIPTLDEKWTAALAHSTRLLTEAYESLDIRCIDDNALLEGFHEALVAQIFGLSPQTFRTILSSLSAEHIGRTVSILEALYEGIAPDFSGCKGWYQHTLSRLSDADKEQIKYIPPGGNWQSIPEHVPSKRLEQIRQMTKERGVVRTTYYGRLRGDQPAYTISTYYNRPGNGTNLHPYEQRTISSREAARLQSFPDWYYFLGTETSIRNQIGNAVPPLLAYAVGKKLAEINQGLGTCVDVFSGAGGLSLGLELAGWDLIASADNDKYANQTYAFNRPTSNRADEDGKTLLIESDLSAFHEYEAVVELIRAKLKGKELDLLVGGPPCQGFSHAGFRKLDDQRNNLAKIYINMAEALRPKTFVLENVEGLLTAQKGQVFKRLNFIIAGDWLSRYRAALVSDGRAIWRTSDEKACFCGGHS